MTQRYLVIEEKIVNLLEEKFLEEDFNDCFLIDIKLHATDKLEVFIDSDSGVTFEKCRRLSRYLERHIDEAGLLHDDYVLEVSSPGLDRPLKLKRQYRKNIGRKVEVKKTDGQICKGVLVAVDEEAIMLEERKKVREGKSKKSRVLRTKIPFEDIDKTVVKVSF